MIVRGFGEIAKTKGLLRLVNGDFGGVCRRRLFKFSSWVERKREKRFQNCTKILKFFNYRFLDIASGTLSWKSGALLEPSWNFVARQHFHIDRPYSRMESHRGRPRTETWLIIGKSCTHLARNIIQGTFAWFWVANWLTIASANVSFFTKTSILYTILTLHWFIKVSFSFVILVVWTTLPKFVTSRT